MFSYVVYLTKKKAWLYTKLCVVYRAQGGISDRIISQKNNLKHLKSVSFEQNMNVFNNSEGVPTI